MNPREKAIVELVRQDWKDAGRSMSMAAVFREAIESLAMAKGISEDEIRKEVSHEHSNSR
jgi:hypothetical protein